MPVITQQNLEKLAPAVGCQARLDELRDMSTSGNWKNSIIYQDDGSIAIVCSTNLPESGIKQVIFEKINGNSRSQVIANLPDNNLYSWKKGEQIQAELELRHYTRANLGEVKLYCININADNKEAALLRINKIAQTVGEALFNGGYQYCARFISHLDNSEVFKSQARVRLLFLSSAILKPEELVLYRPLRRAALECRNQLRELVGTIDFSDILIGSQRATFFLGRLTSRPVVQVQVKHCKFSQAVWLTLACKAFGSENSVTLDLKFKDDDQQEYILDRAILTGRGVGPFRQKLIAKKADFSEPFTLEKLTTNHRLAQQLLIELAGISAIDNGKLTERQYLLYNYFNAYTAQLGNLYTRLVFSGKFSL